MNNFDDDVPGDLATTVTALRRQADDLPEAAPPSVDETIRVGRRRVARRRAGGAAVVAGVLAVGGVLLVGGPGGPPRTEGPPAAPSDLATVEVRERDVTELYAALDEVLAETDLEVEDVRWSVMEGDMYGPIPVMTPDMATDVAGDFEEVTVPGFEAEVPAHIASGSVSLDGDQMPDLGVEVSRAQGGMSLERDYCSWYDVLAGDAWVDGRLPEYSCEQVRTGDGGLLIRLPMHPQVIYVWPGGQVHVTRWNGIEVDTAADEVTPELMESLATDPRLRW